MQQTPLSFIVNRQDVPWARRKQACAVNAQRDEEAEQLLWCLSSHADTGDTENKACATPAPLRGPQMPRYRVDGAQHGCYIAAVSPSTLDGYVLAKLPAR